MKMIQMECHSVKQPFSFSILLINCLEKINVDSLPFKTILISHHFIKSSFTSYRKYIFTIFCIQSHGLIVRIQMTMEFFFVQNKAWMWCAFPFLQDFFFCTVYSVNTFEAALQIKWFFFCSRLSQEDSFE